MKVIVTCCADCPFKRVGADNIKCKLNDAVLMGNQPGDVDIISERKVHGCCKMLSERVVVVMDGKSKRGAKPVEAFLGNRLVTDQKLKGIVVAKFKNAEHAGMNRKSDPDISDDAWNGRWYRIILDGGKTMLIAEHRINCIIKEIGDYNCNEEFEFYFGHGEADDEK